MEIRKDSVNEMSKHDSKNRTMSLSEKLDFLFLNLQVISSYTDQKYIT